MKVKVYVIDLPIPSFITKWGLRLGIPTLAVLAGGVAFAGPPTTEYADGSPLTAKALTDNFNYLQNQITTSTFAPRTPSAFRATLTNATTIQNTAYTPVTFNEVAYDLGSEYSAATGTFSPKQPGLYLLECGLSFLTTGSGYEYQASVLQNGNVVAVHDSESSANGYGMNFGLSTALQLASGDSITCEAYQATGAAQPIYSHFPSYFAVTRLY